MAFQGELHDWRNGSQSNSFFARLGVLFGKTRIAFILEPLGESITSDFARAHVLVGGVPALQSDSWEVWSEQFRDDLPDPIRATVQDELAQVKPEDPQRSRRIRERLDDVLKLLQSPRFRANPSGAIRAGEPEVTGAMGHELSGEPAGRIRRTAGSSGVGDGQVGRGRSLLSQLNEVDGVPSREVRADSELQVRWVTEVEAESHAIVNGGDELLRDRAAALVGASAATARMLLVNQEFRGYRSMLAKLVEDLNPHGDESLVQKIDEHLREWIEQKLVEAVKGVWQLENGTTWLGTRMDSGLSPTALTAVFLADRWLTMRETKQRLRAAGIT